MKKIMVFNVPAESGGALTILHQYYEKAKREKHIEWIFVLGTPELDEQKNIKILRYPWIKKSWFHRLYFDNFAAHIIAKKYQPDEILSLQNTIISKVDVPQTLYLHQPLPFAEKRYKITENFKFWIYQNIISKMIYNSIRKANRIIVQTKWIKQAAINKTGAQEEKFILQPPKLHIPVTKKYSSDNKKVVFFYPASAPEYKNHMIIVEAAKKLIDKDIDNFVVVFTLEGNENNHISKLYKQIIAKNLPIKFIGSINQEQVYEYYSKSVLIFPSYIETFGLPLLEARNHRSPILASDLPFSHEILDGYQEKWFFDPHNVEDLEKLMSMIIN